jgi:catechol 2,3-dioxygenase-like lactoylglutathione lyase family enzyme
MSGINHIGITVTDIDAAMDWYVNTFGLRVLADSPIHCDTTTEGADRRADVFGKQWGGMKLAHLEADNGGGIELFQFLEPQVEKPGETFPYWLVGTHHVALTVDDFDATLERIVSTGGTQRTQVHDIPTGARVCYCEDPWGNVVEIVSTTYAELVTAPAP